MHWVCVDALQRGGLNPELMALPVRRFRVLAALLLCALVAAPLSADAQSKRGKRGGAKKKAPAALKVPVQDEPPVNDTVEPASASASQGAPSRGPTRIDFDDRLIQGQTNKSGAVYLYDRKELKQRSMVKVRESFREEIVQTIYDR